MINSVTVTNHLGETLKIDLRFPEKSGFIVKDITGLGPSRADVNSTELSTTDGALYNSARVNSRNIVLTLGFMFQPNIETVRQRSYKYFPIKKRVSLIVETDNRICEIFGYVESNEPNIFSRSESTQISIICPDPYFYSTGEYGTTVTVFNGIEPNFEFPFSNESVEDQMLEVGTLSILTEQNVYYDGDSEIGVNVALHAVGDASNVTIYNTGTREMMFIDTDRLTELTGSGIIFGDDIFISTMKGSKSIYLLRGGVYINILNCLSRDSNWFQLAKGDNVFAYSAESGGLNLQFRIENKKIYEGV